MLQTSKTLKFVPAYNTVKPPNKEHFWTSHFVLSWEVVLFSEVKNELLLWERGPEECPLLGGCPYLGGSFIGSSLKVIVQVKDSMTSWRINN